MDPEALRARNRRNIVIALALAAFVALVFVITMARLGAGVLERPL